MHLTQEEADRIIKQESLQGAREMFRIAGEGGPFPSPFGDAKPGSYGSAQYAAQDRPVVDPANMPGRTLAQGQPQTTSLMNIGSTLPPLHLRQRRRFG
jgi:hypothetical protein